MLRFDGCDSGGLHSVSPISNMRYFPCPAIYHTFMNFLGFGQMKIILVSNSVVEIVTEARGLFLDAGLFGG